MVYFFRYVMTMGLWYVYRHVMTIGLWSKYDMDGHYFIFAVQILVNYNNYILYDVVNMTS